jgi:hypothetical protein
MLFFRLFRDLRSDKAGYRKNPDVSDYETDLRLAEAQLSALKAQFCASAEALEPEAPRRVKPEWEIWDEVLKRFGYRAIRLGSRANVSLKNGGRLLIRLEEQCWEIQRINLAGVWETLSSGNDVGSLREYLLEAALLERVVAS